MISEVIKINYLYCYVDDLNGNYEDYVITTTEDFPNFKDGKALSFFVESYLEQKDHSIILKKINRVVGTLGKRYFDGKEEGERI